MECGGDLTVDVRKRIIETHNEHRRKAEKGEVEGSKGKLPAAMKLADLEYDCGLEQEARRRCKDFIDVNFLYGLGANDDVVVGKGCNPPPQPVKDFLTSFNRWWEQSKYIEPSENNTVLLKHIYNGQPFAQIASSKVTRVGCQLYKKGRLTSVLCLYNSFPEQERKTGTVVVYKHLLKTNPSVFPQDGALLYDRAAVLFSAQKQIKLDGEEKVFMLPASLVPSAGEDATGVRVVVKKVTEGFQVTSNDLAKAVNVRDFEKDKGILEVAVCDLRIWRALFIRPPRSGIQGSSMDEKALMDGKYMGIGLSKSVKVLEGEGQSCSAYVVTDDPRPGQYNLNTQAAMQPINQKNILQLIKSEKRFRIMLFLTFCRAEFGVQPYQGPIKDAWDDDAKDCIASLNLSSMLPMEAKPRSSIRVSRFRQSGNRIDTIPLVATHSPDGPTPRLVSFTGSGDEATQFSLWLRRLEDVMRLCAAPQQKGDFLICYLDGAAREKVEELSRQEHCDFNAIVAFEGPVHGEGVLANSSLGSQVRQPLDVRASGSEGSNG
ncbi:hypothetical protein RB195_004580 [Necator americanus]|uniref:SCP domain-containing protein n=1 Tax=Necator americanus TaxID=51031 RepID=A0ABR1BKQ5_NECAM